MTPGQWLLMLAGCASACALTPLVRRYAASRGMVDHPGPRRSHDDVVPRGGGLAIALVALPLALLGTRPDPEIGVFVGGGLLIAALGWADDRRTLPAGLRLLVQGVVAVAAVLLLGPVESIQVGGADIHGAWLWSTTAVIALVWLMNLFNFMDGADGLAATQSLFSLAMFAVILSLHDQSGSAWIAAAMAAAVLGFLYWNRPRATVFLGDSGSLFLGWCAGFLALVGTLSDSVSVALAFIVVSPFVVDATATLCWRLVRGERWYTPHRDHAYQFLIRAGWSHRRVLLAWIAVNAVVVIPAAALAVSRPALDLALAAAAALVLTGAWYLVHFVHHKKDVTA